MIPAPLMRICFLLLIIKKYLSQDTVNVRILSDESKDGLVDDDVDYN